MEHGCDSLRQNDDFYRNMSRHPSFLLFVAVSQAPLPPRPTPAAPFARSFHLFNRAIDAPWALGLCQMACYTLSVNWGLYLCRVHTGQKDDEWNVWTSVENSSLCSGEDEQRTSGPRGKARFLCTTAGCRTKDTGCFPHWPKESH